jgi:tetratricopeptide (TPR) repeat protein
VLDLDPQLLDAYVNLGRLTHQAGDAREAARLYALELDPDFADAHFNLAGLCERLGRKADALRHYQAYKKLTQA